MLSYSTTRSRRSTYFYYVHVHGMWWHQHPQLARGTCALGQSRRPEMWVCRALHTMVLAGNAWPTAGTAWPLHLLELVVAELLEHVVLSHLLGVGRRRYLPRLTPHSQRQATNRYLHTSR